MSSTYSSALVVTKEGNQCIELLCGWWEKKSIKAGFGWEVQILVFTAYEIWYCTPYPYDNPNI